MSGFARVVPFVCLVAAVACGSRRQAEVRELMQAPIAPASDALFNAVVYTNGQLVSAPQDDAQWARLREHALSLIRSSGPLAALAPDDRPAEWRRQSAALELAASEASQAIAARSLDGVLEAGGRVYDTCTGCHAAYAERAD